MNPSDSTPEIMQNAEFVVIQLPSEKARAKRVLKKSALVAGASAAAMVAAIVVIQRWDNQIPFED